MVPDYTRITATEWRHKVVHDGDWTATAEERPGGEAQGFFVSSGETRGYLKPTRNAPPVSKHPRAAHEKIAADLAFDLQLPVPAAVLVDGTKCGSPVSEAVVSLVMYPEVHKWKHAVSNQASKAVAHEVLRSTRAYWSGMFAFDTWLDNKDRKNAGNLLIGTDPRPDPAISAPIFCDFANSLLFAKWREGAYSEVKLPAVLPVLLDFVDPRIAREVAERIKGFSDSDIAAVVNRIPENYLGASQKSIIIGGLSARKKSVVTALAAKL